MRSFSRVLTLAASLILALGTLALPLRPAQAQAPVATGAPSTSSAVYQVVAVYNSAVFVNGIPASPGTTYTDSDSVSIDAGLGGYTVLSRNVSGVSSSWTHYGSVYAMTFQAIWIGD